MKFFYTIFKFIETRGVKEDLANENYLTSLLNGISFFTFLGGFGLLLVSIFYQDYIYSAIILYISLYFGLIPVLHHFTTIKHTRLFYALGAPLWYSGAQLLVGGYFGQGIAAGGTILVVYFIFKQQVSLRNKLIIYNLILFIATSLYITYHQPLLGKIDYPFDELVVTLMCIGWISIVFFVYDLRLNKTIDILKQKNQELTQKTQELKRFNYIASHDLKTPLRNITNFIGLINREQKNGKQNSIDNYLKYIESNAHQMSDLIEGVLEVSRIDYISNPTNVKIIDLNEVFKLTLSIMEEYILSKKAIIKSNPLPKIYGNKQDFLSIFQKITYNGLNFNHSFIPSVNIYPTYHQEYFQIHFKDNGIGISAEYYEQIFELFKKLHNHSEFKGSGLGLSLSKKIISKYNGTISVESTPGLSSIFTLTLPNSMLINGSS